jgi:hypothetical protein
MAIETPKYTVIRKYNNIELRQYSGYIQAEVEVDGLNYSSAIDKGFGILAGYIFGNNVSQKKIDMTAPVKTSKSERIAMTSPVKVSGEGTYSVAFFMPSRYTLENLPIPNEKSIILREIKPEKIAAIRFSGFFNQKNIDENIIKLKEYLAKEKIKTDDVFIIAGYNPPWIPGFLARNEAMIKIKE